MKFLLSRIRRRSTVVVPVAVLVAVAGVVAMLVAPQTESSAAPSIPSVTWNRAVFNAGGHDSCEYEATLHIEAGVQTEAAERTASEMGLSKVKATSEGVEIRSDPYDCTNENVQAGAVTAAEVAATPITYSAPARVGYLAALASTGHVTALPAGYAAPVPGGYAAKVSLGQWIVGAVVGTVVGAVMATYGAPVIVSAAAAVGVTITVETASIAAVCIGIAVGGAIGEYIKGGSGKQIAVSTILGCAAGAFITKFMSAEQAGSVVADAIESELAAAGESATGSAAQSVSSAAESISTLASDAQAVSQSAPNLSSTVGQQLRRSASI